MPLTSQLKGNVYEVSPIIAYALETIILPYDTLADLAHWVFNLHNQELIAAMLAKYLNDESNHPRNRLILARFLLEYGSAYPQFEGVNAAALFVTYTVGMAESVISTAVITGAVGTLRTAMEQTEPELARPFLWLAVSLRRPHFAPNSPFVSAFDFADGLLLEAYPGRGALTDPGRAAR